MKKNFRKQLNIYTAVAGSITASGVTDAQTVYTDINPDTVIHNFGSYLLDVDNNGLPEMKFEVILYPGNDHQVRLELQGNINNAVLGSLYQANYPLPFTLNNGDSISGTNTNWQNAAINSGFQYLGVIYNSVNYGNWLGVNDKYLGIRFKIGSATHYGWARLGVAATGDTLTIKEYAYQAVPDLGITAGQTITGIPVNNQNDSIRIFASSNTVVIQTTEASKGGTVNIINTLGQNVYETTITEENIRISLEGKPAGIYFVEVTAGNTKVVKKVYIF